MHLTIFEKPQYYLRIIRKLCCIFYLCCCSCSSFASDISTKNVGEQAMIRNLREAINQDSVLSLSKDKIIIGAGVSGAEAFKKEAGLNELHVILTWQWLDKLQDLAKNTIVVVPKHAVNRKFKALEKKGIKLIVISGVLHQKSISKVQNESVDKINPSTRYIVMLAGDTQKEDGSWVNYDRKMLEDFLVDLPQDQNILILNGPRTGKHLENTNIIDEFAHKTEVDYITRTVEKKNFQKWQIIDYKYGEKSLWDSALSFCIKNPKVGLILPGESTSMISEALGLGILPIIYKHKAMTLTSYKYIKELKKEGKILEYSKCLKAGYYAQKPTENQIEKIVRSLVLLINH